MPASVVSLPTDRTLTATDGRTITVTILDKTATGIKARLNGKTMDIALNTLSADDQAFIARCKAPVPIGKKILYVINYIKPIDLTNIELLKTGGYDVTFGYMLDAKLDQADAYGNNPASKTARNIHTAKDFDIYWVAIPGKPGTETGYASDGISLDERTLLGSILKLGRTVILNSVEGRPYKWYMGTPLPSYPGISPLYVKTEKNLILYNNQLPTREIDPTILPKVMTELKEVVVSNHR